MFMSITGHEKTKETDKLKKLFVLKGRVGIVKKYLNKMKIVEHCNSVISEVPIRHGAST